MIIPKILYYHANDVRKVVVKKLINDFKPDHFFRLAKHEYYLRLDKNYLLRLNDEEVKYIQRYMSYLFDLYFNS